MVTKSREMILVRGVSIMRRIDKRADYLEVSPEQLTAIVIDTEV